MFSAAPYHEETLKDPCKMGDGLEGEAKLGGENWAGSYGSQK